SCAVFWGRVAMSDLIERYIHQVVAYLPPNERAEIDAELRSLIQDQLEDRFESPSEGDVATILAEMGRPHEMAISYSSERYLVGPALYPYLIMVLWRVVLLAPAVVIFLNIFGAVTAEVSLDFTTLIVQTLISAVEVTLILAALTVFIFAIVERANLEGELETEPFDPQKLPEVNDPRTVDRAEAIFGIALGTLFVLALLYFFQVGGLTLRFDLNNPGEVIPVSRSWLLVLAILGIGMIIVEIIGLRRNHWDVPTWLLETVLELVALFGMYFTIYKPLLEQLLISNPSLADMPLVPQAAEIIVLISAIPTLIGRGNTLVRLWEIRKRNPLLATEGSLME
ncbi:MAG: hypothetical protein KC496_21415, partial [Anaerolineae bacterium]|nr:hypothetical protein [Anaerolineae bacterium]